MCGSHTLLDAPQQYCKRSGITRCSSAMKFWYLLVAAWGAHPEHEQMHGEGAGGSAPTSPPILSQCRQAGLQPAFPWAQCLRSAGGFGCWGGGMHQPQVAAHGHPAHLPFRRGPAERGLAPPAPVSAKDMASKRAVNQRERRVKRYLGGGFACLFP